MAHFSGLDCFLISVFVIVFIGNLSFVASGVKKGVGCVVVPISLIVSIAMTLTGYASFLIKGQGELTSGVISVVIFLAYFLSPIVVFRNPIGSGNFYGKSNRSW